MNEVEFEEIKAKLMFNSDEVRCRLRALLAAQQLKPYSPGDLMVEPDDKYQVNRHFCDHTRHNKQYSALVAFINDGPEHFKKEKKS